MKPKSSKPVAAKKKTKTIDLAAKKREQQRQKEQRLKKKRQQQKTKDEAARKAKQLAQEKALAAEKQLASELEQQKLTEQRLAEQQRKAENEQRQQDFADALAAEGELLLAEQDEVSSQAYVAEIARAIGQHWSRPPSARRGMTCELQLRLIPTGEVVSVSVSKGSGNDAFDRSAEQAVKRLGRFESLADMPPVLFERYFRQFTLLFDPQDLRL
jgi:colicin import membrane protein